MAAASASSQHRTMRRSARAAAIARFDGAAHLAARQIEDPGDLRQRAQPRQIACQPPRRLDRQLDLDRDGSRGPPRVVHEHEVGPVRDRLPPPVPTAERCASGVALLSLIAAELGLAQHTADRVGALERGTAAGTHAIA